MSRDVLSVDSNTLDSTISVLNRASVFLDDSVSHSKNSFSYLQSSPTLSKGINTLHNNMGIMAQRLKGFGNTLNKQNSKMIETENYLEGLIDGIEVPTELANVDTTYQSERVSMDLKKNDGKSVNSDDNTTKQSISEESKVEKVQLEDINNSNGKEQQEFDDTHIMDKQELDDINNELGTEAVVLDDKHSFEKEELNKVNDAATGKVALENEYDFEKEELRAVEKSPSLLATPFELDDSFLTTQDINETEDILKKLKGE